MYITTSNVLRSSDVYISKLHVCHYSCHFLGLIHSLMKREHVIEQGISFPFFLEYARQLLLLH
jgi:hypothetical protein